MTSAPRPTPPRVTLVRLDYLKLAITLMAAVIFAEVIEHWDDFKAGFRAGYESAARR